MVSQDRFDHGKVWESHAFAAGSVASFVQASVRGSVASRNLQDPKGGGGSLSPGQTYRDKLRLGACEISLHGRDVSSPARLPGEGEWQSGNHHRSRNLFQVAQRGGMATATTMKYRGGPGVCEKLRRQDAQAWGACSTTSDGRVISWVEGGCSRSGAQGREEPEGSTGAAALNSKRTKPTPQRSPQVLQEWQEGGAGAQGRHAQCGIPRLF